MEILIIVVVAFFLFFQSSTAASGNVYSQQPAQGTFSGAADIVQGLGAAAGSLFTGHDNVSPSGSFAPTPPRTGPLSPDAMGWHGVPPAVPGAPPAILSIPLRPSIGPQVDPGYGRGHF